MCYYYTKQQYLENNLYFQYYIMPIKLNKTTLLNIKFNNITENTIY